MRRRPALCLLSTLLALATSLALFSAALTIGAPRVTDPRPAATERVVRTFYTAVNQALATGQTAAVESVVADDLVAHGPLASLAPGRMGLTRYLASLYATQPRVTLTIEQIVPTRDRALVYLTLHGGEGRLLGRPLRSSPPAWGPVDAVAVAGRQVVEYWSGAAGLALLEPVGQASWHLTAQTNRLVTLDRLTIPPGGSFVAQGAEEARLLFVETGSIAITAYSAIEYWSGASGAVVKETGGDAGDLVTVPTWSQTVVHNVGSEPASLLVLAATTPVTGERDWEPDPGQLQPPAAASTRRVLWQGGLVQTSATGAIVAPLTGSMMTALPGTQAVVAVGRVTLAPRTLLASDEAAGPQLLVVNAGTLDLIASGKPEWIYRGAAIHSNQATLDTASGALLHAGMTATLSNAGSAPVVVTIVAILPADTGSG